MMKVKSPGSPARYRWSKDCVVMEHKCDLCEKPAQVHEVLIKNGQKHEIHLCPECASAQGYGGAAGQLPAKIAKKLPAKPGGVEGGPRACRECGLTHSAFRRHGVLGCPGCYQAFEKQLEPLISRAQGGATHHCGHVPEQASGHLDRQVQRTRLLKQLNEAIATEQYERAARIRDTLQGLSGPLLGDHD